MIGDPSNPGRCGCVGRPRFVLLHFPISLLLVLLLLTPVHAQVSLDPEGKTVRSIEIEGNQKIPTEVVLVNMKTKMGRPFSEQVWGEDVRSLYKLGFWNVRRDVTSLEDGIRVRIVVQENPFVRRVRFKGVSSTYKKELVSQLNLSEGTFLSEFTLELISKDAIDFYKSKGNYFAEVDYTLEKAGPEDWEAVFHVVEGPHVKVEELRVVGNVGIETDDIIDAMESQESGLFKKGSFVMKTLEQDIVAIRVLYRHLSYLDARVHLEDLMFSHDKSEVIVVLRVQEGVSYHVRSVGFMHLSEDGDPVPDEEAIFSRQELEDLTRLKSGMAYLFEDLRRDVLAIRRKYENLAYIEARINPVPSYDVGKHEIDLLYQITEGRRYRMGKLLMSGNILTQDKVIRRTFTLSPGDLFSYGELRRSENRMQSSGYFDYQAGVEIETQLGDATDIQDVSVRVREGRTGELRFAAGIGSDSGFIGQVSITKKNFDIADWPERLSDVFEGKAFVGGGQSLFLDLSPGTQVSRFRLGFREPSVFGTLNNFGADLYRRNRVFRRYDVERTGVEFTFGRTFEQFDNKVGAELAFRNELVDLHDVDVGFFDADADGRVEPGELEQRVPDNVLEDEGKARVIGLRGTLRWEDLDHPVTTTEGFSLTLTGERTGNLLGGDIGMTRAVVEGKTYFPIYETLDERRHVLALRSSFGWSEANDGTPHVPVYERFFAGGISSLRGFEFRSVGPQEFDEPTGGEAMLLNGAEYTFPLYERLFRGALFVDGGLVSENINDLDLDEYRVAIGGGFQFFIPFLGPTPFTIYFGFPIRKEDTDDRQVVTFTLGRLGF